MESAFAAGRVRIASTGLTQQDVEIFLDFHVVDDSTYDLWLLADLTGPDIAHSCLESCQQSRFLQTMKRLRAHPHRRGMTR